MIEYNSEEGRWKTGRENGWKMGRRCWRDYREGERIRVSDDRNSRGILFLVVRSRFRIK